jgi:phage portal protein BeeE
MPKSSETTAARPSNWCRLHPDNVAVLRVPRTRRITYQVTDPEGGTRRLLPDEVFHLKDRSDDGIVGKSRLERAREAFGTAIAVERHAATRRSGIAPHVELASVSAPRGRSVARLMPRR